MKAAYPAVFTKDGEGYTVYVPDFDCYTQGSDLAEAIYMARDVIGLMGIDYEDDGKNLPVPSTTVEEKPGDIVSFVDVDFTEYRRANERRTVRKSLTIPCWLNKEAESAGINFSQLLTESLKLKLGITG